MAEALLKFGFHNFLNAEPVLVPLCRLASGAGFEMVLDAPSVLAERLGAGELDLAMIPAIEYLKHADDYALVPGISIASRGPVGSVLLVSGKPLTSAMRVAVDEKSRTSIALMKILYGAEFPEGVKYSSKNLNAKDLLLDTDAALIIGDQALKVPRDNPALLVRDLSEDWFRQTGKTFVHAVVAVRPGVRLSGKMLSVIQQANAERGGVIEDIVGMWAGKLGLKDEVIRDYLVRRILYDLGGEELAGLRLFQELALERGLIERAFPFKFVAR